MTARSKNRSAVILNARQAATLAVLATALLPAGASASYSDLRSPDSREAAIRAEAGQVVDLRSPDARDAHPVQTGPGSVDLRSPDARDAGRIVNPASASATPTPQPSGGQAADVTWPYVAGAGLAATLLVGFATATGRRRRKVGGLAT